MRTIYADMHLVHRPVLHELVFARLAYDEIMKCRLVCKKWYKVILDYVKYQLRNPSMLIKAYASMIVHEHETPSRSLVLKLNIPMRCKMCDIITLTTNRCGPLKLPDCKDYRYCDGCLRIFNNTAGKTCCMFRCIYCNGDYSLKTSTRACRTCGNNMCITCCIRVKNMCSMCGACECANCSPQPSVCKLCSKVHCQKCLSERSGKCHTCGRVTCHGKVLVHGCVKLKETIMYCGSCLSTITVPVMLANGRESFTNLSEQTLDKVIVDIIGYTMPSDGQRATHQTGVPTLILQTSKCPLCVDIFVCASCRSLTEKILESCHCCNLLFCGACAATQRAKFDRLHPLKR